MESLLSASAGENVKNCILCGTFTIIFTVPLEIKHIFIGISTTLNLIDWLCLKKLGTQKISQKDHGIINYTIPWRTLNSCLLTTFV